MYPVYPRALASAGGAAVIALVATWGPSAAMEPEEHRSEVDYFEEVLEDVSETLLEDLPRAFQQFFVESSVLSALQEELAEVRPREAAMRQKWIEDEEGWHKLPARAWPAVQPPVDAIEGLRNALRQRDCHTDARQGEGDALDSECATMFFNLASALVFNNLNGAGGLTLYTALAHLGSVEGMTGAGVMLVEGLGVDPDVEAGVALLQQASDAGFAQAQFELGSALYCGVEGELDVDEDGAMELFEAAAIQNHSGGCYMVADTLLSKENDRVEAGFRTSAAGGRAVRLLLVAAEKGHRSARQQLKKLLDEEAQRLAKLDKKE